MLDFKQRTDKNKVFLGSSTVHVIIFHTLLTCYILSYKPLLKAILNQDWPSHTMNHHVTSNTCSLASS